MKVLALTEDGGTLVSGSFDGTIATFAIRNEDIANLPAHLLRGHDSEITCLAVSSDLDVSYNYLFLLSYLTQIRCA